MLAAVLTLYVLQTWVLTLAHLESRGWGGSSSLGSTVRLSPLREALCEVLHSAQPIGCWHPGGATFHHLFLAATPTVPAPVMPKVLCPAAPRG